MIDLRQLREDPDRFRAGAAAKRIRVDIDRLLVLDTELRQAVSEREALTAEKNRLGKQIGPLMGRLKKADEATRATLEAEVAELQARSVEVKRQEAAAAEPIAALEAQRRSLWLAVPQPPDPDVPAGTDETDNVELDRWDPDGWDSSRSFAENRGFEPRSHEQICRDLGLVDFERGTKISGARSYVLTGDGMRLHQAVLRLAFDFMTEEQGFVPLSAACLVRHDALEGTGFFPGGRDQVYDVANPTSEEGAALTGTGEVGLMAFHAGEILDPATLPRTYTTVSTCFRREAGAAGRDTAGLYRIHQFDKVEQVVICEADEAASRDWHRRMIGFVQTLLKRLELPHRLLQCCTGDLGLKNADMVDVECWMPSRNGYGETHSASRLYDFQTRRLNLRYRDPADPKGKRTRFCHSLNNTVAASPRLLIPLLEMHQQADGTIRVPEALRPHLHGRSVLGSA